MDEHRRRYPDTRVDTVQFNKKCAERWRSMTDKEKGKFSHMAELDRKRFNTELNLYRQTDPTGPKRKRTRKPKDPRAPKRSM